MSMEKNRSLFEVLASRQGATTVFVAVIGVALSIAVSCVAYSLEKRSIRRSFDSLADDRFRASEGMFHESAKLMNFMDNVFLIAPPANSSGFTGYVRSINKFLESDLSKSLKMHGLAWVPRVPRSERGDYERTARAVFDPKYQIHAPNDSANKNAGAQQADCYPCYLALGSTLLSQRAGEDLSLDPQAWKAMQRARDTGEATATPPIAMPSAADGHLGYRVFQPLYVGGNLNTVEQRRKACTGFLCLDLDVGVLVDNALKDLQPAGVELCVLDAAGERMVVCRHSPRSQPLAAGKNAKADSGELEATVASQFFGRKLLLRGRSTQTFWADHVIWQPWVLLCGGLALTIALAGRQLGRALDADMVERAVSARLAAIQKEMAMRRSA